MSTETKNKAPTHEAYVVEEYRSNGELKSFWTKVGAVFPHQDGQGFSVKFRARLSVSDRLEIRVVQEDKPAGEDGPADQTT